MITIRTAAAYIRVSTEDQVEFSPDAQLRELRDYAASHGMILDPAHIYRDEGISGRKAEKRPGFMSMISAAKSKPRPFDVVLVHKFDRFARSREDSIVYKSILKRLGIEVVSIKEPLADGAYAGVMEAIYESFAEAYSINLGQEVLKGMKEKALRGEWQTAAPYGYQLLNKQLIPHPVEADYIREIFRRFAAGEAYMSIARWLNSVGQRTKRGSPFDMRSVEYIVHNPVYIGKVRWTPTCRVRRQYSHPDSIIAQGSHQPLVDPDVWQAAQDRAAHLKYLYGRNHKPNGRRRHYLVGILRCADCGATLASVQVHYFRCNGYLKGRCDHSQNVRIDKIEAALLDALRRDLALPAQRISYTVESSPVAPPSTAQYDLTQLRKKKERLTAAYLDGIIPLQEYKKLAQEIDASLEQAIAAAAEASPAAAAAELDLRLQSLRRSIQSTIDCLLSPDVDQDRKHDALCAILSRLTWSAAAQTLTITYRLP